MQCVQTSGLKLFQLLYDSYASSRAPLEVVGLRVVQDEGFDIGRQCGWEGEDAQGSLAVTPRLWRPGAAQEDMATSRLSDLLFTPFWQGWCARVGYPPSHCCSFPADEDTACFDSMHTWSRCCAGAPHAVLRLYHAVPSIVVWQQDGCLSVPPRRFYGCEINYGRAVVCERWEGKTIPVHRSGGADPEAKLAVTSTASFQLCEEWAIGFSKMQACAVTWRPRSDQMGLCTVVLLRALPPKSWDPREWPLAQGVVTQHTAARCLPLLPGQSNASDIVQPTSLDKEVTFALIEVGVAVRRFVGLSAGKRTRGKIAGLIQQQKQTPPQLRPAVRAGSFHRRADAAPHRHCLLTPTHTPHFPHLALLLKAIERLAKDARHAWPLHLIIFDTRSEGRRFCQQQSQACAGMAYARMKRGRKHWWMAGARRSQRVQVALMDLLRMHGESWAQVSKIRSEYGSGDARFGACGPRWGQVHQGLKKIYGLLFGRQQFGCAVSWVMDSESFPVRPFRFADIFGAYRKAPWVQVQSYSMMHNHYGAPQLIPQECAHWMVTHKLRRVPAGAIGYRASDYWIYENSLIEHFVNDVKNAWGSKFFMDVWMRPPARGEADTILGWLHLHVTAGAPPRQSWKDVNRTGRLEVLDIATVVRAAMPELYARSCTKELSCDDDFAVVALAAKVLGLPFNSTIMMDRELSKSSRSQAAKDFLALLSLLDTLPIYGMQGHSSIWTMAALPALLRHWRKATSWCLSNCDWLVHAGPVMEKLGMGDEHKRIIAEVHNYPVDAADPHNQLEGTSKDKHQGKVSELPALHPQAEVLMGSQRCVQYAVFPAEDDLVRQSWDRCLDIVHIGV